MGRFIYRAQIGKDYFLNFADADPQPGMAANMIYRYGKDINDKDMMRFGAYYRKPEDGKPGRYHYFRNFFSLFMQDEYQKQHKAFPYPKVFGCLISKSWLQETKKEVLMDYL
jgi:hypothetical protein